MCKRQWCRRILLNSLMTTTNGIFFSFRCPKFNWQTKKNHIHPFIHLLWIGCSGKHKQDGTIFILILISSSSSSSWLSCFCLFDFDSFWWSLPPLLLIDANGQSYLLSNKIKKRQFFLIWTIYFSSLLIDRWISNNQIDTWADKILISDCAVINWHFSQQK